VTAKRKSSERARHCPGPLRASWSGAWQSADGETRRRRAWRLVASVLLISVVVGACGAESTDTMRDADEGSGSAATTETQANGSDRTGRGRGDAANGGSGSGQGSGDLPAGEICERIPAADVEAALGISPITANPSSSPTPQCSYVFETDDGTRGDATIAALRTEEDLDGRRGQEAFDYVVNLNSSASRNGDPTRTELSVGDRAVLLSGGSLHFGVVQLGLQIVTTIVSVRAADTEAAAEFSRLVSVLAV